MNDRLLTLRTIYENKDSLSQRDIAKIFDISLGKVNTIFKDLTNDGYIQKGSKYAITEKGLKELKKYKVDNAVILACDSGIKLEPLTYDTPKSFLKVEGKSLIERQIEQLHEKKINDITIVIGYLKEKFEYLIDKYNVKLIYNEEYKNKNTLATIIHAKSAILGKNTYICVSDVFMKENIFHEYEFEPYYCASFLKEVKSEWQFVTNSRSEMLGIVEGGNNAYCMMGPAFFTKNFSNQFLTLSESYYKLPQTDKFYWEDVLVRNLSILPVMYVYKQKANTMYEFDSLKDLREYDKEYNDSGSFAFSFVAKTFGCREMDIVDIVCMKNGMTNNSYRFKIKGNDLDTFICRVVGDGTNNFIDRTVEKKIYDEISKIDDDMFETLYAFDEKTGVKISKFFDNAEVIDINNEDDLKGAMKIYKRLHNSKIKINESNDLVDKINEYLNIIKRNKILIPFEDFKDSLNRVNEIMEYLKNVNRPKTFTHGDANPNNILKVKNEYKIIDFEYGGMADPIVDIALFSVYSDFNIEEAYKLLDYYLEDKEYNNNFLKDINKQNLRKLIVIYMALIGFYNSIWAMCRTAFSNTDYGFFNIKMYRYFKKMYSYLKEKNML